MMSPAYQALTTPDCSPAVLDAAWVLTDEAKLARCQREQAAALDKARRKHRAYKYIAEKEEIMNIRIKRLLLGAMCFFLWALALSLLVG